MRSLVTLNEAAKLLRCHPMTVRRRIKSGDLKYIQFERGGRVYLDEENIVELIEKSRKEVAKDGTS